MTTGGGTRARLIAGAVLTLSVALAALIVSVGPGLAEGVLAAAIGPDTPAFVGDAFFNLLIFGALLTIAIVGGALSGVRPFALGQAPGRRFGAGTAIGVGGVLIAVVYARLGGSMSFGTPTSVGAALLLGLGVVAFQAGAEEIYFRGWVQPSLERAWGPTAAIGLSALVFAALHFFAGAHTPLSILNLFLGGVLFGALAWRGRGIAGAVGAHVAWNATEQLVLGLDPNPGLGSFGSLWNLELAGAALWGGSEEGLNASAAMTIALLALLAPMAVLSRRRHPAAAAVPA